MAAPVVASYTTGGVTASLDYSFVLAVPGVYAPGDLLLMVVAGTRTWTGPPAGFTLVPGADTSPALELVRAYFRLADGTETAWTVASAEQYNYLSAICVRITGAQAAFVAAAAHSTTGWSAVQSPDVTTTAADSLLLWVGTASAGYNPAKPTAATAIFDITYGAHLGLSVSSTNQATAGLVTGLAEPVACDNWSALTIAVAPAGVAGFTGSGAVTLGPTVTATGHAAYTGAGNVPLGPTVAATGQAAYAGSGTVALGPTVAATGHAGYAGAGNVPLGPTVSASGGAAYVGFAVAMLGPTVSATGSVANSFSGSGTVALGPTVAATGHAAYAGSGTVVLGPTVTATGAVSTAFAGAGSVNIGPTVAATGSATYTGAGSVVLGPTVRATGSAGSTAAASAGSLVLLGLGGGPLVMMGLGGGLAVAPPPPAAAKMIRRAVLATLKADATLAALVGANVFPSVIPETSLMPAVVYQFGKIARQHDLDGPTGVSFASVTIYGVSKVATECESVAEAVRQIFDGFTGTLVTPSGGVRILETDSGDEGDTWEPPADATGRGVFEIAIPYTFMYLEPLPARMT